MGIFHEMKPVINRGRVPLTVTFDGQQTELPVGESHIPTITVNYAKNQNPVMGSCDPNNPSLSGGQYLIGVKGVDNCEPLTDEEWLAHCEAACRMDWVALTEDTLGPKEHIVIKGTKTKNKIQAKSSFDAGVRVGSPTLEADTA